MQALHDHDNYAGGLVVQALNDFLVEPSGCFLSRRVIFCDRRRRWVVYRGGDEASRVPPVWHAWLHYTSDTPPAETAGDAPPWRKEHMPNVTGTALAYRPPGHTLQGGRRDKATGDYDPWTPGK